LRWSACRPRSSAVLRLSARDHLSARARRLAADGRAVRPGNAEDPLVHDLAGGSVDRAHARGWDAARVGDRSGCVPRTRARTCARRRSLRPADCGRRDRVPRTPSRGHAARHRADPLAHVFFNVAVVVRVVGGYWARLDPRLWDAAATLGASPSRRFRELTLPALRPALAAASALTSFLLHVVRRDRDSRRPALRHTRGGHLRPATQAFDLRAAAALSLLQLAAVAAIVLVSSSLETRAGASNRSPSSRLRPGGRAGGNDRHSSRP